MSFSTPTVVPYVGTWIEMMLSNAGLTCSSCRSLRGNVDRNAVDPMDIDETNTVVPYVGTWIEILS